MDFSPKVGGVKRQWRLRGVVYDMSWKNSCHPHRLSKRSSTHFSQERQRGRCGHFFRSVLIDLFEPRQENCTKFAKKAFFFPRVSRDCEPSVYVFPDGIIVPFRSSRDMGWNFLWHFFRKVCVRVKSHIFLWTAIGCATYLAFLYRGECMNFTELIELSELFFSREPSKK